RGIRARQRVVRRQGRRVHAVVGYLRQIDDDLEQQAALARGLDVAGGAAAIGLLQPVFNVQGLARERGEVHDDVRPLRDAQGHGGNLDGRGQQVAVVRDLPELVVGAQVGEVRQIELLEARRAAVEPAEAVAPGMYVQHGLDDAVDQ